MDLRDAQLQHEASMQAQYDREHCDANQFRDYTLVRCAYAENEPGENDPPLSNYFALHEGDDSEVRVCVQVGSNLGGEWTWGICGCDYDETRAVEVHYMKSLLPREVQREFQSWLEKREKLEGDLAETRGLLLNLALPITHVQIKALACYAARLQTELQSLKAA